MKKYSLLFLVISMIIVPVAMNAQMRIMVGPRMGYGYGYSPRRYGNNRNQRKNDLPSFKPFVSVSLGYGFPNLDKEQLPGNSYNYYQGNVTQTGPVTGSIDYQFSRLASIGVLVTHGNVSIPYYDYNAASSPAYTGKLDNWSIMLNYVSYIPVNGDKVSPYLRTAIGFNLWNKINQPNNLPDLAYQLGLGVKFNLTDRTGLFVEGGYGKYILHGGLSFKI